MNSKESELAHVEEMKTKGSAFVCEVLRNLDDVEGEDWQARFPEAPSALLKAFLKGSRDFRQERIRQLSGRWRACAQVGTELIDHLILTDVRDHDSPLIEEIVLAGSLAKGTAVEEDFDVDLVIIFKNFAPNLSKLNELLDWIASTATEMFPASNVSQRSFSWYDGDKDKDFTGKASGGNDIEKVKREAKYVHVKEAKKGGPTFDLLVGG